MFAGDRHVTVKTLCRGRGFDSHWFILEQKENGQNEAITQLTGEGHMGPKLSQVGRVSFKLPHSLVCDRTVTKPS